MNPTYIGRARAGGREHASAGICLLLAAVLTLSACGNESVPAPPAFPSEPSGRIEIKYPLDETLFPPEIVAPTFVWSDETEGVKTWMVLLRFDHTDEVLRFPTTEPRWRPAETDWAAIKQRSRVKPNRRRAEQYDRHYATYVKLYDDLKDRFADMAALV